MAYYGKLLECSVPLFHHESTTTTTTCLLTCLCCSSVIIDCGCDVRLGHSIAMDVHSSLNLCLAPSTPKSTNKLGGKVKDDAGKNRVTLTQRLPQRQRLHVQSVQLPLMAIRNAGGRGNLHRYFLGRTSCEFSVCASVSFTASKTNFIGKIFHKW